MVNHHQFFTFSGRKSMDRSDRSFTTGQENWGGRYGKSDRLEDVSGKRGTKGLAVAEG